MKNKIALFVLFICVSSYACSKINPTKPASTNSLGLQVSTAGILIHNGNPYRGVGVNYFNAFYRNLQNASDTTFKAGFRYLKSQHIPFVRFMACGFWPIDWKLYLTNKNEYFDRLDQVVHSAETIGIGLIPSLFWNYSTVPDIVGESVNQWGNKKSKTIAFMKKYTEEVVNRYKSSPAIWGWEFGNEFNLQTDLPGLNNLPPTSVNLGCPATRSAADKISTNDMIVAFTEFASTIRKYDVSRIIFSGTSIPRGSAYHLDFNRTWDKDRVSQYAQMLNIQNPLNSITIHLYPGEEQDHFADKTSTLDDIIQISMNVSKNMKKPLFIGEFGASKELGETEQQVVFYDLLHAIEVYKVPLASLWVFDYSPQDSTCNVTSNNSNQYMINAIRLFNDRMNAK
jgi:hypothetical protein